MHGGGNDDVCCTAGQETVCVGVCLCCVSASDLNFPFSALLCQGLKLEDLQSSFHWAVGTLPQPQANELDGLPAQI